jgi:DNA-binding Xre family transcriptional regulator
MPGTIELRVESLLVEAEATPIDLARAGISPTTAYNLRNGKGGAISYATLVTLCDFFSSRLGRQVDPGDILFYTPGGDSGIPK